MNLFSYATYKDEQKTILSESSIRLVHSWNLKEMNKEDLVLLKSCLNEQGADYLQEIYDKYQQLSGEDYEKTFFEGRLYARAFNNDEGNCRLEDILEGRTVEIWDSEKDKNRLVDSFDLLLINNTNNKKYSIPGYALMLLDCKITHNTNAVKMKSILNCESVGYTTLANYPNRIFWDTVYCSKCKTYQPNTYCYHTAAHEYVNTLSFCFLNNYMQAVCPHCGHRIPLRNILTYKQNVKISDYEEGGIKALDFLEHVECVSYYLDEDECGTYLRSTYLQEIYNTDKGTLSRIGTLQSRFTFNLKNGNIYYFKPVPICTRKNKNRKIISFTNYVPSCLKVTFTSASRYLKVPTKRFKHILYELKKLYGEWDPYYKSIPTSYMTTGVDLESVDQPFEEVMRLVQFPLLSSKCYNLLREIMQYVSTCNEYHTVYKRCFLKPLAQLRANRLKVTDKQIKQVFGIKHLDERPEVIVFRLSMKGTKYSNIFVQKINQYFLGKHKYDSCIGELGDVYQLLTKECKKGLYYFYRYFQDDGYSEKQIEKFLFNLMVGEDIYFFRDTVTTLAQIMDLASKDENIQYINLLEKPIPTYKRLRELKNLPADVKLLLKKLISARNVNKMHDDCTSMFTKFRLKNTEIKYDESFLKHIKKGNTFTATVNGELNHFKVIPAVYTDQLLDCTTYMHICTITYYKAVLEKRTNILFLVNTDYSVESGKYFEGCIELSNDFDVQQIKGRKNKSIMPELKPFVERWASINNLHITTRDLALDDSTYIAKISGKNPYETYIAERLREMVI